MDGYIEAYSPDASSMSLTAGEVAEYAVKVDMITSSGSTLTLDTSSNVKLYGPMDSTAVHPTSIQRGSVEDVSKIIIGYANNWQCNSLA